MKHLTILLAVLVMAIFAGATIAAERPSHLDRIKNPLSCAGCHKGHGKRNTQMLTAQKNEICFTCHGNISDIRTFRAKSDMSSVFSKRYKHPVIETGMYHNDNEELPEKTTSAVRHVACQDCHNVHEATPENPTTKIKGYKKGMKPRNETVEEYEICYKCHSESANLPYNSKNKGMEFDPSNLSYHPVEAPGKNRVVPSLIKDLNISSLIKCTDCHGNSDPFGPKGPHGSDYEFILKKEYIRREVPESPFAYDLCYSCHSRQSILGNDSFKKHKEHVVYQNIPCSACHTPHGTNRNLHLIEFEVTFTGYSPMPSYMSGVNGRPVCYLKCHVGNRDVIHDNNFYSLRNWP